MPVLPSDSITRSTPAMSPGCHPGGCCCWSRCRSSVGSTRSLPPSDASACSSVGTTKCQFDWALCTKQFLSHTGYSRHCAFGLNGLNAQNRNRHHSLLFTHQWVCVTVTLWRLFSDSFSRGWVAIEPDILWPELQQRGPVTWRGGCWPRVGVNHPGSWVFPCSSAAIQLQRETNIRTVTQRSFEVDKEFRTTVLKNKFVAWGSGLWVITKSYSRQEWKLEHIWTEMKEDTASDS